MKNMKNRLVLATLIASIACIPLTTVATYEQMRLKLEKKLEKKIAKNEKKCDELLLLFPSQKARHFNCIYFRVKKLKEALKGLKESEESEIRLSVVKDLLTIEDSTTLYKELHRALQKHWRKRHKQRNEIVDYLLEHGLESGKDKFDPTLRKEAIELIQKEEAEEKTREREEARIKQLGILRGVHPKPGRRRIRRREVQKTGEPAK